MRLMAPSAGPRTKEDSQAAYARFAGLMYLVVLALDVAGLLIVSGVAVHGAFVDVSRRIMASELLYRGGLCLSLLGSMSTILLAVGLFVAVRPADANLAMTALMFRTAEAVVSAVGIVTAFAILDVHLAANHTTTLSAGQLSALADLYPAAGTNVSAIFFSFGSAIFFVAFLKSKYIPRILSAWGLFASIVYLAYWFGSILAPQYSSGTAAVSSLPILIAEVSTAIWLLVKGVNLTPRVEQVTSDRSRVGATPI